MGAEISHLVCVGGGGSRGAVCGGRRGTLRGGAHDSRPTHTLIRAQQGQIRRAQEGGVTIWQTGRKRVGAEEADGAERAKEGGVRVAAVGCRECRSLWE